MTFRCDTCGNVSKHGEAAHRVTVSTKPIRHPFRAEVNKDGSDDPGGNGTAIAKEKIVCASCALEMK